MKLLIILTIFSIGYWLGWAVRKNHEANKSSWKDDEIKLLKNSLNEILRRTGRKA